MYSFEELNFLSFFIISVLTVVSNFIKLCTYLPTVFFFSPMLDLSTEIICIGFKHTGSFIINTRTPAQVYLRAKIKLHFLTFVKKNPKIVVNLNFT